MSLTEVQIKILLIEDNPGDVRLFRESLADTGPGRCEMVSCDQLAKALELIASDSFDVIFVDLSLPDSTGLETVLTLRHSAPDIPLVILTGSSNENLVMAAVKCGAQDYLVKGEFSPSVLVRSMRYAIERNRLQQQLKSLSLTDDLTGLHNRRGFLTFAEQHLKVVVRSKRALSLLFIDVDGMKRINDGFGHAVGDIVLQETARIMRAVFRESDIVARIGGDEFAVIALDTNLKEADLLCQRLKSEAGQLSLSEANHEALSLSVGVAHYDPESPCSAVELLERADDAMYCDKRRTVNDHHNSAQQLALAIGK